MDCSTNHNFYVLILWCRDRTWRDFRTYKSCFLGSAALAFLTERFGTKEEGLRRGNELISCGYCLHVVNEHLFEDSTRTLFYHWIPDAFLRTSQTAKLQKQMDQISLSLTHLTESVEHAREQAEESAARLVMLDDGLRNLSKPLLILTLLMGLSHFQPSIDDFLAPTPPSAPLAFYSYLLLLPNLSFLLLFQISFYAVSLRYSTFGFGMSAREAIKGRIRGRMDSSYDYESIKVVNLEDECQGEGSKKSVRHRRSASLTAQSVSIVPTPQRSASTIPPLQSWMHRPIMVCVNTGGGLVKGFGDGELPIGVPFHFESELFLGKYLIRLRDVPSENPRNTSAYFQSRRRQFQVICQGKFKEPISVSDVLTGHEFSRPLKNLPAGWVVRTTESIIKKLAPSTKIELSSATGGARALSLLAATAQNISIDAPGMEPDIMKSYIIPEHNEVFGGKFAKKTISANERKKFLSKRADSYR